MTPSELFDNADAYVLDLLEPEERAAFDESLDAASPELRRQLRAHMRRVATGLEETLPAVEPDPGLRFRVFASIRESLVSPTDQQGSSWWSSTAFWRAACLGFATAAVTLGAFGFAMQRQHDGLERSIQASIASAESQRLGPVFARVMFADQRREVDLDQIANLGPRAAARLAVDAETGAAVLFAFEMPVNEGKYRVELRGEDGTSQTLATFVATPGLSPVTLPRLDLAAGGEIVIVGPGSTDSPARDLFRVTLT